jgi:hypothetical protein
MSRGFPARQPAGRRVLAPVADAASGPGQGHEDLREAPGPPGAARPLDRDAVSWAAAAAGISLFGMLGGAPAHPGYAGHPGHAAAAPGPDTVLFVSPTGSDGPNDCQSASAPCATIRHALTAAASGDTIDVAKGRHDEHGLVISIVVTIAGPGAAGTVIDAQHRGQAILVESGASLTLHGVSIAAGRSPAHAGAIENSGTLTLEHDRFWDDSAADPGGAIVNYATITALAYDQFTANHSQRYGGAIENFGTIDAASHDLFSGNLANVGAGAVDNQGSITSLDRSSFIGNRSGFAGGLDNSGSIGDLSSDTFWDNQVNGYGGAISNVFGTISAVTDDTFAGNVASDQLSQGGAIEQDGGASIGLLADDTIIGNQAALGGGLNNDESSVNSTAGVIIALNRGKNGPNCLNFSSTMVDSGDNLESDAAGQCGFSAAAHDLLGVRPGLRPLGAYGGPTLTAPPLPGSPVIDAGPAGPCPTAADQRGVPRPQGTGGRCDIGAVEWAPPAVTSLAPASGPPGGGTRVRLTGRGFTLATSVTFGRTPAWFHVVSASVIVAISPPGHGIQPVRVRNPDESATSSELFSYS